METKLRKAAEEWRAVLRCKPVQARQIVQKLLAEKITFEPENRKGSRGFRFEATGTVEKLVDGVVPGSLLVEFEHASSNQIRAELRLIRDFAPRP